MCNTEFPLVQLLKGGEETSWRVIKAREAACPPLQLACPPPRQLAHHQGSVLTSTCSLQLVASRCNKHQRQIHKYTLIQIHKYTWIQIHKYLNHNGSPSQHCLCVTSLLAKLTLQNIEYFSIRTLWASLATKNPHHLFADSLADSH